MIMEMNQKCWHNLIYQTIKTQKQRLKWFIFWLNKTARPSFPICWVENLLREIGPILIGTSEIEYRRESKKNFVFFWSSRVLEKNQLTRLKTKFVFFCCNFADYDTHEGNQTCGYKKHHFGNQYKSVSKTTF